MTEGDALRGLAERLVGELMLVSVLVAGEGADGLTKALMEAGAAAESLHGVQGVEGVDLAILLSAPDAAAHPATRAAVDALARASDRLLLVPLPLGGAGADGASPPLAQWPQWFELFAELGYQPVVEFDARFVGAGAVLVDRAATADEGDLAAFTDRLQLGAEAAGAQRAAVQEAERSVRTELQAARAALAASEAALAGQQAALATAHAAVAELSGRAAALAERLQAADAALSEADARNAGWDGLRGWVRLECADPGRDTPERLARTQAMLCEPGLPPVRRQDREERRWPARLAAWLRRRTVAPAPMPGSAAILADAALVRASRHFDAAWYVAANPAAFAGAAVDPALHYVLVGAPADADPGPWFDAAAYVAEHPDAAGRALLHAPT